MNRGVHYLVLLEIRSMEADELRRAERALADIWDYEALPIWNALFDELVDRRIR